MVAPAGLDPLSRRLAAFDVAFASRWMRRLEDNDPAAMTELASLPEPQHPCLVVAITGAGGVGKSTLVSALLGPLRRVHERIGVLAVDPSSPVSGGAVLGDRVRMAAHATDPGVFIRSVSARGGSGGIAPSTALLIDALLYMRCDIVIVETVGVGQAEDAVAELADHTVLVAAPYAGDTVQAMKAGLVERASLMVLNKADLSGASAAAADLRAASRWARAGQQAPVLRTVASTGAGVQELAQWLLDQRVERPPKPRFSGLFAILSAAAAALQGPVRSWLAESSEGRALCRSVVQGQTTPSAAASRALEAVVLQPKSAAGEAR